MIGSALGIERDRLAVVAPGLLGATRVVGRFGQQVIARVVVAILQQRFEHLQDFVPLALLGVNLGQRAAGFDVVGRDREDLAQQGFGFGWLLGVAVGAGQVEPVAGPCLVVVVVDSLAQQLDRTLVIAAKERVAALLEQRVARWFLGQGQGGQECRRQRGPQMVQVSKFHRLLLTAGRS